MSSDVIAPRARIGVNPQFTLAYGLQALIMALTDDATNPENAVLGQFTTDANGPTIRNIKGRGTVAAPADAAIGDRVFDYQGDAFSGTTTFNNFNFRGYIDGAFVSGQAPPMRLVIETGIANGTPLERLAVFSNGFTVLGADKIARGVTEAPGLLSLGGNATVEAYLERASADTTPARLAFRKTRGTLAAPADVVNGDILGYLTAEGRSTTNFETASIQIAVDAAVVAAQRPASRIDFFTNLVNSVPTRRMMIGNGGLVGIGPFVPGTVDPGAIIHVSVDSGVTGLLQYNANDSEGSRLVLRKARGTLAAPTLVQNGDRIFQIYADMQASNGIGNTLRGASIESYVDGAVVSGQRAPTRLEFYTNASNTVPALRVVINNGGLVGIGPFAPGTVDPGAIIHVSTDSGVTGLLQYNANDAEGSRLVLRKARGTLAAPTLVQNGDRIFQIYADMQASNGIGNTLRGASIESYVDGAVVSGQRAPTRLEFYTNASNATPLVRMTITNGGRVGIGIASPSSFVDIASDTQQDVMMTYYATDANGAVLRLGKARGTQSAPSNVANADEYAVFEGRIYSNSFQNGAKMSYVVDGTFTAGNLPPSRIEFYTNVESGARTRQVYIDSNGVLNHKATALGLVTLTDAATITVDANLSDFFTVTLGGNRTLGAPTNAAVGRRILIRVRQDGTGSRTLAYNAIYRFPGNITPTLSLAANTWDYLAFVYNAIDSKWDMVGSAFSFV